MLKDQRELDRISISFTMYPNAATDSILLALINSMYNSSPSRKRGLSKSGRLMFSPLQIRSQVLNEGDI